MDYRGWRWWEKWRIRCAWWAFQGLSKFWFKPWRFLSGGRVWAHESRVWLTIAAYAWLIDDLWRHDLPEHQRIGGEWR